MRSVGALENAARFCGGLVCERIESAAELCSNKSAELKDVGGDRDSLGPGEPAGAAGQVPREISDPLQVDGDRLARRDPAEVFRHRSLQGQQVQDR